MNVQYRARVRDDDESSMSVSSNVVQTFTRTGPLRDTYEDAEADLELLLPGWPGKCGQVEKLYFALKENAR